MKTLKKLEGQDNSVKFLFELDDGNTIETLYMNDKTNQLTYHSTVCISSQVGCSIGCKFCATGRQALVRDLSVSEIIEQVMVCNSYCLKSDVPKIDAVVFAGMGEPLLNYENVKNAIEEIGTQLGNNNFELATVGILPRIFDMINDFTGKDFNVRLNLSLHAPSDDKRKLLIPITSRYSINEILNAAVEYARAFGSKVRIRYMLFKGFNDTDDDANRLIELLENKPLRLIISQYNNNNIQGLVPASQLDLNMFYEKLRNRIDYGIFHNFGSGINGGCGQLRQERL